MEKAGKGQAYPNAGRENHEAAKRWITECFAMARTSLSLGKCDFWQAGSCWRSSQPVSESILSLLLHSEQSGAKLLLCLYLWGHFNKLKFQIIWRFLWQKEKYKVNCFCFFFFLSFRSLLSSLNRYTSHLIAWICMDLKLFYCHVKDAASIAFIHRGSYKLWKEVHVIEGWEYWQSEGFLGFTTVYNAVRVQCSHNSRLNGHKMVITLCTGSRMA